MPTLLPNLEVFEFDVGPLPDFQILTSLLQSRWHGDPANSRGISQLCSVACVVGGSGVPDTHLVMQLRDLVAAGMRISLSTKDRILL